MIEDMTTIYLHQHRGHYTHSSRFVLKRFDHNHPHALSYLALFCLLFLIILIAEGAYERSKLSGYLCDNSFLSPVRCDLLVPQVQEARAQEPVIQELDSGNGDSNDGKANDGDTVSLERREIEAYGQGLFKEASDLALKYTYKYNQTTETRSHNLSILHCLLFKESRYGSGKGKGDGGLASGPLQFHEATYQSYRSQMMKAGLANHVGSRDDLEDAVDTTAWAIANGRAKAWGPVYRGECR
jgi:hypothetical protein